MQHESGDGLEDTAGGSQTRPAIGATPPFSQSGSAAGSQSESESAFALAWPTSVGPSGPWEVSVCWNV